MQSQTMQTFSTMLRKLQRHYELNVKPELARRKVCCTSKARRRNKDHKCLQRIRRNQARQRHHENRREQRF